MEPHPTEAQGKGGQFHIMGAAIRRCIVFQQVFVRAINNQIAFRQVIGRNVW